MLFYKTVFLLLLFSCSLTGLNGHSPEKTESDITKFMKFLKVIPDVIPEGPKEFLKVTYDSGVFADKGVELTPTQVKNQPNVNWESQPKAFYTLILTGPDAPAREFHHWLVGNIPENNVAKGEVLSAYVGAAPSEGTGLHRYVFLLYKQSNKITFDEEHLPNNSAKGRSNFSTQKFAEKYKLGVPVAGNFFQAQYDAYVPELHKQLGA